MSNWARKNARSRTLVDKELWEMIQRQYPEECERRARGQDTVEDDFEDGLVSYPAPLICKPGEIRQEYEAEINKIEAERLSREEEERKASEEYIRKLLAEEEEQQRINLDDTQRQLDEQLKRDEALAWMLSSDLNETTTSEQSSIVEVPVVSKLTPSSKSSKNVKAKSKQSGDIERFLTPKSSRSIHIQSSAQINSENLKAINSSLGSSVCVRDSDEDSMPSLSPQFTLPVTGRKRQDSDTEVLIPCLYKCLPDDSDQSDLPKASYSRCSVAETIIKLPSNLAAVEISPPMSTHGQGDCGWWSTSESGNVTSTPEQCMKTTAKRALEYSGEEDYQGTEKRQKVSLLDNNSIAGVHTERLMELEETLIQKKIQEDQDRLMAIKLQKLLDKEDSAVIRRKGSPDEYKLRSKRTTLQQDPSDIIPLKSLSDDSKEESPGSGDTSDENKKPDPKKRTQQNLRRAQRTKAQSSEGLKVLRPSNKQQTILDMFQRSAAK